jgi:UDP-GlcNAc3NAcA epimerase
MMKLLTIIGARPQFIKAAAVSRAIANVGSIKEIIVHTGQHFDKNMSDIFFEEMHIPRPQYHLDINSLSHGAMTGRMMEAIEQIILDEKPDYTLVYGDTNSTLAGALAAKKVHRKVVHVEAGLRSFNMDMPEEINRILTDRISDVLFCPTDLAIQNLKNEGFDNFNCLVVQNGDVMEDAALYYAQLSESKSTILGSCGLFGCDFILCTIHRAENTDHPERLSQLVSAINQLHKRIPVVLPLHPRTHKLISAQGLTINAKVIEPVGYFDMLQLIRHSSLVLTDSGGLQKEAFIFNKFCITLREQTEWRELVDHDYNILTGTNADAIYKAVEYFLRKSFVKNHDFYGSGKASDIIVNTLLREG